MSDSTSAAAASAAPPVPPRARGKNIVLLSDGTGNSSARLLKTNVWRIYESLQLSDPNLQVACYDDGVGTSGFAPLRLLGGAIGVGLRRNVLRLYRFLCEHYDEGDRIYVFGFSRGAFTVRLLVGLIVSQGIIRTRPTSPVVEAYPEGDPATARKDAEQARPARADELAFGAELTRRARWAYRHYRRRFGKENSIVAAFRALRDLIWRTIEIGKPAYSPGQNHRPPQIRFVGVWDTVDAYGLPVDELTEGVDKFVWPLSMPDQNLSPKVERACHVLALDDERNTFHPVLWNEKDEPQDCSHIQEERVSQVWFAGMHSNVGGGYADDSLSYISLDWMAREAHSAGLLFTWNLLLNHTGKADPFGRVYDSRSGLKGYYRYNPRRIESLTNTDRVTITRPKIHESVLARIAAAPEAYAPIVFPRNYAVVRTDGTILKAADNPYEPPDMVGRRADAQEKAWNLVWWRRLVYFLTVTASVGTLALPILLPAGEAPGNAERTLLTRFVEEVGEFARLPHWWIEYYVASPIQLIGGLIAVLLLMWIGSRLQQNITGRMRGIWMKVVPPPVRDYNHKRDPTSLEPAHDPLATLRRSTAYQRLVGVYSTAIVPYGFGLLIFGIVVGLVVVLGNRVVVSLAGGNCKPSGQPSILEKDASREFILDSQSFCAATHLTLEAGGRYRLDPVANPGLKDDTIPVTAPAGFWFHSRQVERTVSRLAFLTAAPLRRVWGAAWFVPIAQVGAPGGEEFALPASRNEFTVDDEGELFLYVNDAILPFSWTTLYKNNHGTMTITITRTR